MKKSLTVWILSGALFTNLAAAESVQTPHGLRIEVLSGERSVNSVTSNGNAVPPDHRVRMAGGAPAAGVKVRFELMGSPKLGLFAGQQSSRPRLTFAGRRLPRATGPPAPVHSPFERRRCRAPSRYLPKFTSETITRPYSIDREHHSSKAIWVAVGAGAAGAVTAILIKSRSSSSSSATISIGNPTVAGPR